MPLLRFRCVPGTCCVWTFPATSSGASCKISQSSSLSVKTIFSTSGNSGVGHYVLFTLEFGRVCQRPPRSPSLSQVLTPELLRCAFDVAGVISRLRQRSGPGPHHHSATHHSRQSPIQRCSRKAVRVSLPSAMAAPAVAKLRVKNGFSQEHTFIPLETAYHPNVWGGAFARRAACTHAKS